MASTKAGFGTSNREQRVSKALNNLLTSDINGLVGNINSVRALMIEDPEVIDFLINPNYEFIILNAKQKKAGSDGGEETPPYRVTNYFIETLDLEKQRLLERIVKIDAFKQKFEPINERAKAEWSKKQEQIRFDASPYNGGSYRRRTNKRSNKKFRKTKSKRH
jgi:hypothetical protein